MPSFLNTPGHQHGASAPIGVLLTNVGTPAAPTGRALRPYLAQFLGDRRIIEMPRWLWLPILHGILLNVRPRRSARLYKRVWTPEGSPLLATLAHQARGLQAELDKTLEQPVRVVYGMRYGEPSIQTALRQLHEANVRRLVVFPLFPQYSATTTATTFDAVFDELKRWRWMPELRTINHYHDHPAYIAAVAATIREHWAISGEPERLLFSFHGIPRSYFLNGDPYYCECQKTARLLAEALDLPDDLWQATFQSRFGPSEWLQPYTDKTLEAWGREGVTHVDALCPGFSADCLETTDEIGVEGKHSFHEAGGGAFHYIPALNDRPEHIALLADITRDHLRGWLTDRPGLPPARLHLQVARQREELGLNGEVKTGHSAPPIPDRADTDRPRHIVIVGGGITGLSAAWELQQAGNPHLKITVLEKEARWGGKILTRTLTAPDGGSFVIDAGPESFVTRKPALWQLVKELGLTDQIRPLGSEASGTYVLDQGRPLPLPLSPAAFLKSPLLSWQGKLRMLAEPFVPRRQDGQDESLAAFVTRRLGREALEKFIGPVLGGIYNTDPERQSILVTSPVMREMEEEAGSLVLATIRRALRRPPSKADAPPARFIGFTEGAEELVRELVAQLEGDLRLNAAVSALEAGLPGERYTVVLASGERLAADAVILATMANVAAELLRPVAPAAAGRLDGIRHNHIGTLSLAYRAEDFTLDPPVSGLMIPRREGRRIDAVTWSSGKDRSRAPQGYELLRVFFGGGDPSLIDLDEKALVAIVREELRTLLGVTAEPIGWVCARWPDGYPQADVGHLDRVAALEADLPAGLAVSGSSYRGLAVPDCVQQGRESARRTLAELAYARDEAAISL